MKALAKPFLFLKGGHFERNQDSQKEERTQEGSYLYQIQDRQEGEWCPQGCCLSGMWSRKGSCGMTITVFEYARARKKFGCHELVGDDLIIRIIRDMRKIGDQLVGTDYDERAGKTILKFERKK